MNPDKNIINVNNVVIRYWLHGVLRCSRCMHLRNKIVEKLIRKKLLIWINWRRIKYESGDEIW